MLRLSLSGVVFSINEQIMEYSINDISWLQKSIESMESKGLSPKGRIVATEVIKPTGEKSVRLVMDGVSRDFQSPIDAVDWIVEYNIDLE